MGEIFNGGFAVFRRYAKPLIGVMLAVQGIGILVVLAGIGATVAAVQDRFAAVFDLPPGDRPDGADVAGLFLSFVPVVVLLLVVVTLCAGMISALCPAVTQEAVLGRPTTFGAMWRRSRSRLPSVLGTVLLTGLIVGGPLLVLYAICVPLIVMSVDDSEPPAVALSLLFLGVFLYMPVAVWLMTRFSFASAAAVCEELRPVAALRRSSRLVSGDWWRVFGITMLGYLVAGAVGYIIQMPFSTVGMIPLFPTLMAGDGSDVDVSQLIFGLVVYTIASLVGGLISAVFQYGFPQLVITLLYVDQRMRKENLAPVLIAAVTPAPAPAPAPPAAADEV
ncbi:hypothetical protein [Streptomyces sp. NBC_01233]|uniref:hypothetical protein n=1 Tax=Streptomyces sp. NBC_01233 TaxID=2903787 RepID=UPI002E103174|nr:hypothetical protein OG332_06550 [Streptomyces sp. NBC_01233]